MYEVTSSCVSAVISGLLLACSAVLVIPAAARLMLDPADPAGRTWRLFLPVAAVVGMLSMLLPAGGVALGLALFYLLWAGYLTAGAVTQAARSGGSGAWSYAASHLVLVAGAVLLVLERAGWQAGRAGWLLAAAAAAHLTVGLTGVAIAWDRLTDGARAWVLPGYPLGAALLLAGWAIGPGWAALPGALLLLCCAAVTGWSAVRGARSEGADRSEAAGRRRARVGTGLATAGLLGPLAAALTAAPAGLWLAQLGLAVTATGLVVAAAGWVLLLAPVSSACAAPVPAAE